MAEEFVEQFKYLKRKLEEYEFMVPTDESDKAKAHNSSNVMGLMLQLKSLTTPTSLPSCCSPMKTKTST